MTQPPKEGPLTIPFLQARNYTKTNGRTIDLVVVHDMEAPEDNTRAETVARWFSTTKTPASAHFCLDPDSIVQCVRLQDVAWHAPGANHNGIGLEHAGYARQTREQWLDPPSMAILHLSAKLARDLCDTYGIPVAFVDAKGLLAGRRGITTHKAVSDAFKRSSHWDPGPGFPMDIYLAMIRNDPPAAAGPGGPAVANAPFAAILVHPDGGYLEIGEDGGVFNWGGAPFYGSLGGSPLNQPIVDAQWAPDFAGYYLLGRDGGIFAFGSAQHQGNALWGG